MEKRTGDDLPVHAHLWGIPAARGVLAAVFGLLALFEPYAFTETLLALFGVYVLLDGVISSLNAVIAFRGAGNGTSYLLQAGTGVVAGAVAILNPTMPATVLNPTMTAAILLGVWGIVSGGCRLAVVLGMDPKLDELRLVLTGIGAILLGAAMFLYPVLRGAYLVLAFVGYTGLFALIQFNMAARTGTDT